MYLPADELNARSEPYSRGGPSNCEKTVMCRILGTLTTAAVVFVAAAQAQAVDYDSLLKQSRAAIVHVKASEKSRDGTLYQSTGTGFIIPPGNLVLTAAHIVTRTRTKAISEGDEGLESQVVEIPKELGGGIKQLLGGLEIGLANGRLLDAEPAKALTFRHVFHDYFILKIEDPKIPSLSLGSWKDAEVGDELTIWGFPLGLPGPALIKGSLSASLLRTAKFEGHPQMQDRLLIFQGPNNKGMSGGPVIHNKSGKVLGIVVSRLVGISSGLQKVRQHIASTRGQGSVLVQGVDPNAAIFELINVLDSYLMSGMGSSVAIDAVEPDISER